MDALALTICLLYLAVARWNPRDLTVPTRHMPRIPYISSSRARLCLTGSVPFTSGPPYIYPTVGRWCGFRVGRRHFVICNFWVRSLSPASLRLPSLFPIDCGPPAVAKLSCKRVYLIRWLIRVHWHRVVRSSCMLPNLRCYVHCGIRALRTSCRYGMCIGAWSLVLIAVFFFFSRFHSSIVPR
ncbi:hypothetical protein F4861DRAFT_526023 [Xylaria intraflava]|nr:hypothetical protein F4861DRAFT_526023 [Xylaria intraflava]